MRFGKRKSGSDTGYTLSYSAPERTCEAVKEHDKFRARNAWTKPVLALLAAFVFLSGGVATASATTVSTQAANANVFADMLCMSKPQHPTTMDTSQSQNNWGYNTGGMEADKITDGNNRFAMFLGKTTGFSSINGGTRINDVAIKGKNTDAAGGATDGAFASNALTAYEKYGVTYPKFTSWTPTYFDQTGNDKGVYFWGFTTKSTSAVNDTAPGGAWTYNAEAPGNHFVPNQTTPVAAITSDGRDNSTGFGDGMLVVNDIGSCTNLGGNIQSMIAQGITWLPRIVLDWALSLYGLVTGGTDMTDQNSAFYPLGQAIDSIVVGGGSGDGTGLDDLIFFPFIAPMVILGAMWVLWNGIIKRQFSLATGNVIWMIVAVAAGVAFLLKPTAITGVIEKGITSIVEGPQDGIISSATQTSADKALSDMCSNGITSEGPDNLASEGLPKYNASTRKGQCYAWYAGIYAPWVSGQFGVDLGETSANSGGGSAATMLTHDPRGFLGNGYATIYYGNRAVTPVNWAQFQVDRQSTTKVLQVSEVAFAQLSGAPSNGGPKMMNAAWQTGGIMGAINMLFITSAVSAVFFVYGFSMLGLILTEIVMIMAAPFVFVAGVIPQWGMRKVLGFAEVLLSVFVKRLLMTFILTLFVALFIILQSSAIAGFGKFLIMVALAGFFIFAKGKMVGYFTDDISFGGDKKSDFGEGGIGKAGLAAAGLAGAALGKGKSAIGGKRAQTKNIKKENKLRDKLDKKADKKADKVQTKESKKAEKVAQKAEDRRNAEANGTSAFAEKQRRKSVERQERQDAKTEARAKKVEAAEKKNAAKVERKATMTLGERTKERVGQATQAAIVKPAKAVGRGTVERAKAFGSAAVVRPVKAVGRGAKTVGQYVTANRVGSVPWKAKKFLTKGRDARDLVQGRIDAGESVRAKDAERLHLTPKGTGRGRRATGKPDRAPQQKSSTSSNKPEVEGSSSSRKPKPTSSPTKKPSPFGKKES